jgi:lathosterol oxidase
MLAYLLDLPDHPLVIFATLSIGGLALFFFLAGLSYFFFFVQKRGRFHPSYVADPAENRSAIKWSMIGIVGNALLIMPIHYLVATGHSQIYYAVAERGWGYLIVSLLVMLAFTETCIYWTHRALHGRFLYQKLHYIHHRYQKPTSYVGLAFNPLDSFLQGLPHHVSAFLFPLNIWVYLVSLAFVYLWAVMIHDRVSFVRFWLINNTGHHTLHHWYYDYNFGQYTTLWDRLGGTYRSPFVGCEDVPEGVLATAWDDEPGRRPPTSVRAGAQLP